MCQLPSMRKWVRSVRSSASRISRCLPRGTTSRTPAPVRSRVASWGMRNSPRRRVPPASAVFIRWAASQTVSPSGTRPVSPARGSALLWCETPDNRDDGGRRRAARAMSVPLRLRALFGADVPTPPAEPVTVTVARVVRPDQREAFERWAEDVLQVAVGLPRQPRRLAAAPGPGQLRVPPGLPLRGRRVAGRVGAVVGAAVGARPRRGRWSTTSATPASRGSRASSPGPPSPDRAGG